MPNEVYDFLGAFSSGMNSGVDPLLLPKTQLAFAVNGTVRGDFFVQRPAYSKLNISYASVEVKTNMQTGLFQGAGYYKPDSGSESIALQINGKQFLVSPNTDNTAMAVDISIAGDPDSPSQPQSWIEQAENFLIFNNGLELPIFYDGNFSRRSAGATQINFGTVAAPALAPEVGATVPVSLGANYTGPLNTSIFIGNGIYQVKSVGGNSTAYTVTMVKLYDTSATHNIGEQLVVTPSKLGIPMFVGNNRAGFQGNTSYIHIGGQIVFSFNSPSVPSPITTIVNKIVSGGTYGFTPGVPIGQLGGVTILATYPSYNGPNTPKGTVTVGFTSPAVGGSVDVQVASDFTGHTGDVVWIGTGQYIINNFVATPPAPDTTIVVENMSDTPGAQLNGLNLLTIPELPAGRCLTYGMGRVWESMVDGISFLAGDIVDGASGSPIYNGRDSVLKITENAFLNGGGLFRVPGTVGDIKAMKFVALLDVSLGNGPLQVFTPRCVFGCQAPVDRTTWSKLTNPILTESLIGAGGSNQESVSLANGDIVFRASDGSIRSLLMARLDFNRWSNTPISREMARVLNLENKSLLSRSISTVFDNRNINGTGLTQADRGIYSSSLIILNFDPISSLKGTEDSVYDGQWNGLNVLQLVTGFFSGVERCFAVCLSSDLTQIEINEILPSEGPTASDLDNGTNTISQSFESPVLDFGDHRRGSRNYHRLQYGEIYVDELVGDVQFNAFYKPDQWPDWVPWYSWTQKFVPPDDPSFRPRVGLPMPDGTVFDRVNNRPLREGFWFQFKLEIIGKARFLGARFSADVIPEPKFAAPVTK